jgi:wyosine [tRNA(Phe)-imidazoG37] synthetase (radical SAM superfamily)
MLLGLKKGIIYGPVHSRRLGLSLGINLLPGNAKICPFDCVYCHYGWTQVHTAEVKNQKFKFPSIFEVREALKKSLQELSVQPAYITFSGNGEPTLHPDFGQIAEEVIAVRKDMAPQSKTAILSNSALIQDNNKRKALARLDLRIMKLDCGSPQVFRKYNRPCRGISLEGITEGLAELSAQQGIIIQTLVASGKGGNFVEDNIQDWVERLIRIHPAFVQLYTLDREAPVKELRKISHEDLNLIKERVKKEGIALGIF